MTTQESAAEPTGESTDPARGAISGSHPVHPITAGIAVIAVALNLRTAVTGLSPLVPAAADELALGAVVLGILGMLPAAAFATAGFVGPVITRRFGVERTLAAAVTVLAASFLLRAVAPEAITFVAASAVPVLAVGVTNVLLVPLIRGQLSTRLSLFTSAYLALMQVGQFVAPLVSAGVEPTLGWRGATAIWAAPAALAAVPLIVLAVREHRGRGGAAAIRPPADFGFRDLVRSPVAWALVAAFALASIGTYTVVGWVPTLVDELGGDTATAALAVSLISPFALAGALLVPVIAARPAATGPLIVVSGAAFLAGSIGLLIAPLPGIHVWVSLIGIGGALFPFSLAMVGLRTRSAADAAQLSGFVQGFGYGIAALGPLAVGLLHGAGLAWPWPLALLAVSCVPAILATWPLTRPRADVAG